MWVTYGALWAPKLVSLPQHPKPQAVTFLLLPVSCVPQEVRVCQKVLNSVQWHDWQFCLSTNWGLMFLNVVESSFPQQESDPEGFLVACI